MIENVARWQPVLKYEPANIFMEETGKVIVGQYRPRFLTCLALAAGGHVMAEAMYGLAKTKFFQTVQDVFKDLKCSRIEMTSDLKAEQIRGYSMSTADGTRKIVHGAMFEQNFMLVDEFTAGNEQAQRAFLQVMQEQRLTIDGQVFPLPDPFMIFGTMNPFAKGGTFEVDGAAADRFMFRLFWDYPETHEMKLIAKRATILRKPPKDVVSRALLRQDIIKMREETAGIVDGATDPIIDYVVELIESTNPRKKQFERVKLVEAKGDLAAGSSFHQWVEYGGSPRGVLDILFASAALALFTGSQKILPEHVEYVFPDAARTHIKMADKARWSQNRVTDADFIKAIMAVVKPR